MQEARGGGNRGLEYRFEHQFEYRFEHRFEQWFERESWLGGEHRFEYRFEQWFERESWLGGDDLGGGTSIAGDKLGSDVLDKETLGGVTFGDDADKITKALGKPTKKGKVTTDEGVGATVQPWAMAE